MIQQFNKSKKTGSLRIALCCWAALITTFPVAAIAQNADQNSRIDVCRATTDTVLRLQCYDAIFATTPSNLTTQPTAKIITQAPVVTSPLVKAPDEFGKPTTQKNDLVRPVETPAKKSKLAAAKPPKVTSISEQVSKIDTFGYKKLRITLANGQVWEQVGSITQRPPKLSKKRPLIAEIRKAALSSYSLQFDGKGRAIKVRRVR